MVKFWTYVLDSNTLGTFSGISLLRLLAFITEGEICTFGVAQRTNWMPLGIREEIWSCVRNGLIMIYIIWASFVRMDPADWHHETDSVQDKNIMKQKTKMTFLLGHWCPAKAFCNKECEYLWLQSIKLATRICLLHKSFPCFPTQVPSSPISLQVQLELPSLVPKHSAEWHPQLCTLYGQRTKETCSSSPNTMTFLMEARPVCPLVAPPLPLHRAMPQTGSAQITCWINWWNPTMTQGTIPNPWNAVLLYWKKKKKKKKN